MITIISCIFVLATLVQLLYWLLVFSRLARYYPPKPTDDKEIPVSIVICARNEAENLKKNLPRILNQNYRSFEVIVVNDQSTDETENILLNFNIEYPILHVLTIRDRPENRPGKKYALAQGIHTAKHEVLLLTDADCTPANPMWLRNMQKTIRQPIAIGLGFAPYEKRKGMLNRFIRFETVYTALQYLSFALIGQPYMGVGRNLVYKKSLFESTNGFRQHETIASGDDDLFINAVADAQNTSIILDPSTFMYSEPEATWKNYYFQKSRHYTTGKHYKRKHQILLGLLSISHFLHYLGGIVLLIQFSTMFVSIFYVARILVMAIFYRSILKKFHEDDLWLWIPVLDFALVFHFLIFAPTLMIGKTRPWK
ncbi:MAG: glycosyltransferase [Bacteroidota bacterium]